MGRRVKCRHCQKQMQTLPEAITKHSLFRKKEIPVFVCPECDGGVAESAFNLHEPVTS